MNVEAGPGYLLMLQQMSEDAWQKTVMERAVTLKWRLYHVYDSRKDKRGFPDLVLIKPPHVLYVELKTANRIKSRRSVEQKEHGDDLLRCPGSFYFLWRPQHLDDVVVPVLEAGGAFDRVVLINDHDLLLRQSFPRDLYHIAGFVGLDAEDREIEDRLGPLKARPVDLRHRGKRSRRRR